MATAVDLKEQRARIWERMKEINDRAEAENRDLSAEDKTNWEDAQRELDSLGERIKRAELLERTPAANPESRLIVPGQEAADQKRPTGRALLGTEEYRDAHRSWLRHGERGLKPEQAAVLQAGMVDDAELRALSAFSGTGGAYMIAPLDMAAQIERAELFYGGMRDVATIISTETGADLPYPTSNDTSNVGELLGESTTAGETDVTFGRVIFKAHVYGSRVVRVPIELLQDAAFDIEAFLAGVFGERIGRIRNTHYTLGVAPNQPAGIMLQTVQGKAGDTGSTTTVSMDELIDLIHSVDPAYRSMGCRFMFRDATLQAIRKLKDGEGRYLWQPGTVQGAPDTILSYPYTINPDVPAMAASVNSIAFGLLSKYHIREVKGFAILRLAELYALQRQVAFVAFARSDGGLIDAGGNPVKHYTNAAS